MASLLVSSLLMQDDTKTPERAVPATYPLVLFCSTALLPTVFKFTRKQMSQRKNLAGIEIVS